MNTDPSGRPYKYNEEQHEAVKAEFMRTNTVKTKRRPGSNTETPPLSQPDEDQQGWPENQG